MENIASLVNAIVAVPLLGMLFAALSREGGRGRVSNVLSVGIFTVLSNLVVLWRTAAVSYTHLTLPTIPPV